MADGGKDNLSSQVTNLSCLPSPHVKYRSRGSEGFSFSAHILRLQKGRKNKESFWFPVPAAHHSCRASHDLWQWCSKSNLCRGNCLLASKDVQWVCPGMKIKILLTSTTAAQPTNDPFFGLKKHKNFKIPWWYIHLHNVYSIRTHLQLLWIKNNFHRWIERKSWNYHGNSNELLV